MKSNDTEVPSIYPQNREVYKSFEFRCNSIAVFKLDNIKSILDASNVTLKCLSYPIK